MKKISVLQAKMASDKFKIAMLERGLTSVDVATGIGMHLASFRVSFSNHFPSQPVRRKIEAFFNYEFAAWSDPTSLRLRKACKERFGFDPAILLGPELKLKARALGISIPDGVKNSVLISEILSRVAIKTNPRKEEIT